MKTCITDTVKHRLRVAIVAALMMPALLPVTASPAPARQANAASIASPMAAPLATTPDLGDAPDSTNHHSNITNTAYVLGGNVIPGQFPTVFDGQPGDAPGPKHAESRMFWLGNSLPSVEDEADIGIDADGVNNILEGGLNNANNDRGDDGWLDANATRFAHCAPTVLRVRVSRGVNVSQPPVMYLNVWYDGNRDGDWRDVADCAGQTAPASEWIVRNMPISTTAISGAFRDFAVPTLPVLDANANAPVWLRFSLSDAQAVIDQNLGRADGRGPANGFALGETEDYLSAAPPPPESPDLGDAPDSDGNHWRAGNTAYAGVLGHFPTVWNGTLAGSPSGPIHFNSRAAWLGNLATKEIEADTGPDADGVNNILDHGLDMADLDKGDDGWLNANSTDFTQCVPAVLRVRVSKAATPAAVPLFLNVWRDGNRDGDWRDTGPCDPQGMAFEWIVQNFTVTTSAAAGIVDIDVPTLRVLDTAQQTNAPAWMRFTLSERRAPVEAAAVLADGRGPIAPDGYQLGETEDYRHGSAEPPPPARNPDLGDAPDSSNHHSLPNIAYGGGPAPVVLGRFPTVWAISPTAAMTMPVSGPIHFNKDIYWLGQTATAEQDADGGPDEDGINNILKNGLVISPTLANNDEGDDGWLNRNNTGALSSVILPDCRQTTLRVQVSRGLTVPATLARLFLNVWFDGNRDGDWEDQEPCGVLTVQRNEWIVQNFVVVPPTTAASFVISVPTALVLNKFPERPAWMRFTLSEQPAVAPLADTANNPAQAPVAPAGAPDGRGPAYPRGFFLGETEDYFVPGVHITGTPGVIVITKTAILTPPVAANVGNFIRYHVDLAHQGGSADVLAHTIMTDVLPPEVKLVAGPFVDELQPEVMPLVAHFDPSVGPSGMVGWRGSLSAGAKVRISFLAQIRECPPIGADRVIRNVARALNTNGQIIEAVTETPFNCQPPARPPITLTKRIIIDPPLPVTGTAPITVPHPVTSTYWPTETNVLPGQMAAFGLVLHSGDNVTRAVRVVDDMPRGMLAVAASSNSGETRITDLGRTLVWAGDLGRATDPVWIKVLVKLLDPIGCDTRFANIATWTTGHYSGTSNIATVILACNDLGDAPDSTNHFGLPMPAYPSPAAPASAFITAHYPTVFRSGVAGDAPGPNHQMPRPLHLGPAVSVEDEADIGFDADGVNNIRPPARTANLDKHDDGIVPATLNFANCQPARIPVLVSLDPSVTAVLTTTNSRVGYINVWLDGNRDGDWADAFQCPAQAAPAREHIVVDFPVNLASLRPGLHTVLVPTTGSVPWPTDMITKASWLRVTLSERPSNKVLPTGCSGAACTYGDGRGYALPFRLGETEDYLIRFAPPGQGDADPAVDKRGVVLPRANAAEDAAAWNLDWRIEYRNLGGTAAENVVIVDTYEGDLLNAHVTAVPPLTRTVSGKTISFTVGVLDPGETGFIGIKTRVPITTPPGATFTNTVTILSSNDVTDVNNTDVVTLTIPVLPPIIVSPIPGTSCTGTLTIAGRAQPGAEVDLYIDGALAGTMIPNEVGRWSYEATLEDGTHELYAVARAGDLSSEPSPTLRIIVDSTLTWSPITLRFVDDRGHVIIPRDRDGRLDETGWVARLQPTRTYTVSVHVCCTDPNATVTLDVPGVGEVTLTDADGDQTYEATFSTGNAVSLADRDIKLCVTCELIRRCSDGRVMIDPLGVVFNLLQGKAAPLEDSTVVCYVAQTTEAGGSSNTYSQWPADEYSQINPQTTGADGRFSFFTPPGTYQLEVNKPGFQPYRSWDVVVSNEPVTRDVALTPIVAQSPNYTITIGPSGFEPTVLVVRPGAVIAWVNTDVAQRTATSATPAVGSESGLSAPAAGPTSADAWDSGLLDTGDSYTRQITTEGVYTYYDAENPANQATIVVEMARLYIPVAIR